MATHNKQNDMKKILYFLVIVLWAMGVIGGFGSTLYCKAWPCAVGMVLVALMSWDNVKETAKRLME